MSKKALVTGSTGFVGSNLAKGLVKDGWRVDVIVRPFSDFKLLEDISPKLNIYEYDGDVIALIDIMTQSKPDVVFHVASLFLSDHRPEQVGDLIQSNILFGTQLLEAMSKSGVQSIVNTSTSWEHYEDKDFSPVNLYAATKRAFQDLLQFYVEARDVRAITLKLFDTYGPNDPRPKLLSLLMKIAETGETLAMSPGEQMVDLIHVNDVVSAYIVAASKLTRGDVENHEIYGVGSGAPISLKELTALLESKIEKKLNIEWGERPYRDREVMEPWSEGDRLDGWAPEIDFEEGIKIVLGLK